MDIGTTNLQGTGYVPYVPAWEKNPSMGASDYDLELGKLGREIGNRIPFEDRILLGVPGGGGIIHVASAFFYLNGKKYTSSEGGIGTEMQPFHYTAADFNRANENIAGKTYYMLLEYKAVAEEGSLRMRVIDDWIARLPYEFPNWSGKPIPVESPQKNQFDIHDNETSPDKSLNLYTAKQASYQYKFNSPDNN
jgi:hypothetical protein